MPITISFNSSASFGAQSPEVGRITPQIIQITNFALLFLLALCRVSGRILSLSSVSFHNLILVPSHLETHHRASSMRLCQHALQFLPNGVP